MVLSFAAGVQAYLSEQRAAGVPERELPRVNVADAQIYGSRNFTADSVSQYFDELVRAPLLS